MEQKVNSRIGILEFFIPLYYIIAQYKVAGISLGTLLMVIVIVSLLFRKSGIETFWYRPLLVLVAYMIVHDVLKMLVIMDVSSFPINTWIERLIFVFFLVLCTKNVDEDKLYKVWSFIGIIAMIGLVYHAVCVYIFGQSVEMIKILPISTEYSNFFNLSMRPKSFFTEPAAYVTWILPLLFMALKREKILFSTIITITILLSTSTTGIVMCFILWGYYILLSKSITLSRKIFIFIVALTVVVMVVKLPIFTSTLEKFEGTDFNSNIRITSGLNIYKDSPLTYQIFGIPYGSPELYFRSGEIDLSLYKFNINASWLGFVNSLAYSLLMYGIFGGVLFIRLFYCIFREGGDIVPYVLICAISMLGQSGYFNSMFVMQFGIILGLCELERNVKPLIIVARR